MCVFLLVPIEWEQPLGFILLAENCGFLEIRDRVVLTFLWPVGTFSKTAKVSFHYNKYICSKRIPRKILSHKNIHFKYLIIIYCFLRSEDILCIMILIIRKYILYIIYKLFNNKIKTYDNNYYNTAMKLYYKQYLKI